MFESPVPLVLGVLAFIVLGAFLIDRIVSWMAGRSTKFVEPPPWVPERTPGQQFCRDCGKQFVTQRAQSGYDPKTGRPHYIHSMGCPDGSPSRFPAFAYSMGAVPIGDWPNCGVRASTPFAPVGSHDHPDPVSTGCAACIGDMLTNGAIDADTARKLTDALP